MQFTVGNNPAAITISPDGAHVYAVNSGDLTLSVIQVAQTAPAVPTVTAISTASGTPLGGTVDRNSGSPSRLPWVTMREALERRDCFEVVSNYGTGGDPKARAGAVRRVFRHRDRQGFTQ